MELNELTKYRLNEIDKIKNYFNTEINERKAIVKKISKYIVVLDVADKIFITLSASFGTLSVISHATVVGYTCWHCMSIVNFNIYCNYWNY